MLMVGFQGYELTAADPVGAALSERRLGNTVLFDYDVPGAGFGRNIESPEQVQTLTGQIRELYGGPVLIAADQEGGRVARLSPRWGFPETVSPQALGERNDPAYTREVAGEMAATLAAAGINLNLAPVLDVNVNPANPVIGALERSFSGDPDVVTEQAIAFIEAHHEHGVLCTLKHFPGHGSSEDDSHLGVVDVTNLWSRTELEPFANVIDAGLADAIMTAHIFNANWDPDHPATLSRAVLTGILREELGYDGVIITDDMQMGAIRDAYGFEEAVLMSVEAGADIVAIANNTDQYEGGVVTRAFDTLLGAVREGRLSEARIEESYLRVRRLKQLLA
jgi:beta-N-acetylhexosaminidase